MHNLNCGLLCLFCVAGLILPGYSLGFNVEQITFNSTQDWSSVLTIDDSNNIHIMYRHIDESGGDSEIYYISNTSGNWNYERVTDNTATDYPATIAVSSAGGPHVGYTGNNETQVYYGRKIGGNWVIEPVTSNSNYKTGGAIALGPDSTPNIAYFELNPIARIYCATLVSGTWQIDAIPNSDSASPYCPSLAMDSNDKVHLVFGQRLSGNPDIYYATNKNGTWQTANITDDAAIDHKASLTLDINDFVHVVFAKDDEIYYGNNSTGQFEFEQVTSNAVVDRTPSVCIDVNGHAHIICHEAPAVGDINYYSNTPGYWRQVPVYNQPNNKTLGMRNIVVDSNGYVRVTFCTGMSPATVEVYHAVSDSVVGIKEGIPVVLNECGRLQVRPNPSYGPVMIEYTIKQSGHLNLSIYNGIGQLVKQFDCTIMRQFNNKTIQLSNQFIWDGKDNYGRLCPDGIYFCNLKSNNLQLIKKFVIIK